MGFLSPALLALAAGVAVPLLLHLLHRSEGRRVSFPALRYLLRTEKDHARRIRTRQLLLLLLRTAVVVLATLAAARLVFRSSGAAHPPTAVVVILDNSMSSGRVVGEGRVLDSLKAAALEALELAGPGDRFWVLRAGEPWDLAAPLPAPEARERIAGTTLSAGSGDLTAALDRARGLLRDAADGAAEIHLLSDLQASAFPVRGGGPDEAAGPPGGPDLDGLPVLVFRGVSPPGDNRYIRNVTVGGGLAPRTNRRTEVAVAVGGPRDDTSTVPVRVFLQDQLRGAAATPVQGTAVLPVGPFPQGRLEGYVETDPDELRSDDRFWLTVTVEPPPSVAVVGEPGPFLREALAVLEESGRIRRSAVADAERVFLVWGEGLAALGAEQRGIVVPGSDPALRTALARRLAEGGVPVRVEAGPGGEDRVSVDRTGVGLADITVQRVRRLVPEDVPGVSRWAALADGSPWLVEAPAGNGSVLILGSALDPEETSLPLEATMVPLVEWLLAGSSSGTGSRGAEAGIPLLLSSAATHVETPGGTRMPVDGTHEFRLTREPGIYTVLADEEVLDRVPVNTPLRESLLEPLPSGALEALLASGAVSQSGSLSAWRTRVFTLRQGREIWRLLLGAVLLLLVAESWIASSGGASLRRRPPPPADIGRAPNT